MIYIGLDPGQSGGIAFLNDDGGVVAVHKMPATERDVLDLLLPQPHEYAIGIRAMLEKVGPMPKQGVVSVWTFGKGYGGLRMALTAARIPFDEVTPQKWQQAMGCRTHGDKNVSKRRCQELFPDVKVTHAVADALLLADYCRRAHLNDWR